MMKNEFKCIFLMIFLSIGLINLSGQSIGISEDNSSPNPHAILDIDSEIKGLLIPRMTTIQRNAFATTLGTSDRGMLIFDTDENDFQYWQGTIFTSISFVSRFQDSDEDTYIEVEQTPDDDIIRFITEGKQKWAMVGPRLEPTEFNKSILIGRDAGMMNDLQNSNIAIGTKALFTAVDRTGNIAIGDSSLYFNGSNATGNSQANHNIAIGKAALRNNDTGDESVAIGTDALKENTTGSGNTAIGFQTMRGNSEGSGNVALGHRALLNNRTGRYNIGIGVNSLWKTTTGERNIAIGVLSNGSNTIGSSNIALGYGSLLGNQEGNSNIAIGTGANRSYKLSRSVAIGDSALFHNGEGSTLPITQLNTAVGYKSMFENTIGYGNTALGYSSLSGNIDGSNNVAVGYRSLSGNESGSNNIALGQSALSSNISGDNNIALGQYSQLDSEDSFDNISFGRNSLRQNSGDQNIAVGTNALFANTTGESNIAIGTAALLRATSQNRIIAIGDSSLYNLNAFNTVNAQIAIGYKAQFSNISGVDNIALGNNALRGNVSGDGNTAIGPRSMQLNRGDDNTAVGSSALLYTETGDENTALGASALIGNSTRNRRTGVGYSANSLNDFGNNTGIGNDADCTAAHQVRIGNEDVTSIGGFANWTNVSDGQFKKDVAENVVGLEFIKRIRPVTYKLDMNAVHDFYLRAYGEQRSRRYLDLSEAPTLIRSGFIAQEVEAVAKSLGYDFSGIDAPKNKKDFYGIRYAAFVVPLVKAVQEQQDLIEKLENKMKKQEIQFARMTDELSQVKAMISSMKDLKS